MNRPLHLKGSSENLDLFVRMSVESYCDVVMGGYDKIHFDLLSVLQEQYCVYLQNEALYLLTLVRRSELCGNMSIYSNPCGTFRS